jgi:hypothetical protein
MLTKIDEPTSAEYARAQAAAYAELANTAGSAERREMFLRLRDWWLLVANDLQSEQSGNERNVRMKRVRAVIVANAH